MRSAAQPHVPVGALAQWGSKPQAWSITDVLAMLPAGPKIAFTGGLHFNDHRLIWDKLDQVRGKDLEMALLDRDRSRLRKDRRRG